jgi:4-hydroxybenzoate polyprenyltransferase
MRLLLALLRSSHPGPAAVVTVVTVLLGVAVGLEPARVALLGAVLAFNQLSIGLSNDWIDADRDRAAGRTDKPVARGEVPRRVVRTTAWAGATVAVALSATLGIPFVVAHLIALAGGWSYNAGLKRTPASVVPYAVSFGLLPALATLALPDPTAPAWWAVAAGALLGVAAHVANALPDFDDDAATGVRGLPHLLGRRGATVLGGAALAASAAALAIGVRSGVALAGLALSLVLAVAAVVGGLRGSRWGFRFVMLAALVDVVLLVVAGPRIAVGP